MSVLSLRRFARAERLKSISTYHLVALLRPHAEFLARRGVALPAEGESFDYDALAVVLASPAADTPEALAEALFLIDDVAHGPAAEMLLGDVERHGLHLNGNGEHSPADIAVQVYLQDPAVLRRRQGLLVLDRARTFESFQANADAIPPVASPTAETLRAMEADLDAWFESRKKGRGARVLCTESGPWLCFVIRHGELFKREGAVAPNGGDESVHYRPEKYDAVAYHRALGELRINARSKCDKHVYRRVIGDRLFGDPDFFPAAPERYTLEPLRTDGPAALVCADVDGIESIALVRLQMAWGGPFGEVETREATDLFAVYEARGEAIPREPDLRAATFEVRFADSRRPRRVTVRPPNIASFTRDGDSALVEEWLRRREFVREETWDGARCGNLLAGA